MVQNDHVIHWIDFFHPLNHVKCASFYQGLWISIKMSSMNSMHLENSCKLCPRSPFLTWGPLNFIHKCIIDACCNEQCIITQCKFQPIQHENIIHSDIIVFHVENEVERQYSSINFDSLFDITGISPIMKQNKNQI